VQFSNIGFIEGGGILPVLPTTTRTDRATARLASGNFVVDDIVPETYTWSLSLQRQVAQDFLVELRYVGNHAIHLPVQRFGNPGFSEVQLPIFLQESDALSRNYAGAPTLGDFNADRDLLLAPYGFGGVLTRFSPDGQSWYHGGSINVQKRLSRGFQFLSNYTFSKAIDLIENELNTSAMNPRRPFNMLDIFSNKGLSGLNHSHKFTFAWIYEFPSFSGNGIAGKLLSGWGLNGSYIAESGQPVSTLSFADLNGDFDTAGDPAYENPNGTERVGSGVNAVCFSGGAASIAASAAACGAPANVVGYVARNPNAQFVQGATGAMEGVGLTRTGRGNIIAAGVNNWNLAFYKNTPFWGENRSLRFGVGLYNAFNHPSFAIGNASAAPDSNHTAARVSGFVNPSSSQFLNERTFSGGLGQSPFQRVIAFDMKLIF
jgi:hypothetical protein